MATDRIGDPCWYRTHESGIKSTETGFWRRGFLRAWLPVSEHRQIGSVGFAAGVIEDSVSRVCYATYVGWICFADEQPEEETD